MRRLDVRADAGVARARRLLFGQARRAARPRPPRSSQRLRARLPAYMIPAYLERLPFMPTLISNKPDRDAPAGAEIGAALRRRRRRAADHAHRDPARQGVRRDHRPCRSFGRRRLLQRVRRAFAADGALLRQDPQPFAGRQRRDARRLRQPHGAPSRPRARRRGAGGEAGRGRDAGASSLRALPILPAAPPSRRPISSQPPRRCGWRS